jgi:hypothetical protein
MTPAPGVVGAAYARTPPQEASMTPTAHHAPRSARDHRPTRLAVDPDRLQRMWAMTPTQRIQAAEQGQLTLSEMQHWAARAPGGEIPLVNGEFFFIAALLADNETAIQDDPRTEPMAGDHS